MPFHQVSWCDWSCAVIGAWNPQCARIGHSDLKTTVNVYAQAIRESQERAAEKVVGLLFPNVPDFSAAVENRDGTD